jgi:PAS domain S-box-containing protein
MLHYLFRAQKLQAFVDRFTVALSMHPTPMVLFDLETGERLNFNRSYCQLLDQSRDQLLNTSVFEHSFIVDPQIKDKDIGIQKILSEGTISDYPITIERRSGQIVYLRATASILRSGNRNLVIAFFVDVTEKYSAKEEISMLYSAMEQSPVSIMITDIAGRIEYVNSNFIELTGYNEEEVLGRNPHFLSSGDSSAEQYEDLWKTILRGGIWRGTFHNKKKNGDFFWENAVISPVRNKGGHITHFIGVKEDITAIRQSELERTALEKQVRRSQKLDTMGTLAAGIAHDFNNILSPILGYTDMALLDLDPGDVMYSDMQHVLKAAYRAKDLVEQILLFSKQSEKAFQPLYLPSLIKEALKLLRPSIPSSVDIETHIEKFYPKIMADPTQIHQVIVNLCTNAWQAMEHEGGVMTIELSVENVKEEMGADVTPGDYVLLSVRDTGLGMDEETLEHIYEPFFSKKTVDKGTGLGLSVVHGIVHAHHGFIVVDSIPGKGSSFHIYLPSMEEVAESLEENRRINLHGTETIMVIDDEISIGKLMVRMLKKFGYQVEFFRSSPAALDALKQHSQRYDMILTDLTMPQLSGLDFADQAHLIRPELPILIITGFIHKISESIREEHHIRRVIPKPIAVKTLMSAVRDVFNHQNEGSVQ